MIETNLDRQMDIEIDRQIDRQIDEWRMVKMVWRGVGLTLKIPDT